MATSSNRQQPWPRYARQARERTEETAEDHARTLRGALAKLEKIQDVAFDNPRLVHDLAILVQRDVALAIAALSDIRSWMIEAERGRDPDDP
jgi:C4-dicarboxylate-specific signal transduction histidine kinase